MNSDVLSKWLDAQNKLYWWTHQAGEYYMGKACRFCYFLNSYVCDDAECMNCGRCKNG